MLADALNSGTGYRAREAGFRYPAGGKTGTTNDYKDAWFVGFTPSLVTAVWVGFDQPKTIMPGGYAGQLAAPIWGRFMKDAVPRDTGWVRRPSGIAAVEICRASGLLPGEGCYRVHVETGCGEDAACAARVAPDRRRIAALFSASIDSGPAPVASDRRVRS